MTTMVHSYAHKTEFSLKEYNINVLFANLLHCVYHFAVVSPLDWNSPEKTQTVAAEKKSISIAFVIIIIDYSVHR